MLSVWFDFPTGWFIFFFGFSSFLFILCLLIIFIEALVLYWFGFASFIRSLISSTVMNIVSSLLGVMVAFQTPLYHQAKAYPEYYAGVEAVSEWFFFSESARFSGTLPVTLIFLIISWVISVVSEGGVLWLFGRKHSIKTIGLLSIVANAISYVLLVSPYIVIFIAPNLKSDVLMMLSELTVWSFKAFFTEDSWPTYIILLGILVVSISLGWWWARRAKT